MFAQAAGALAYGTRSGASCKFGRSKLAPQPSRQAMRWAPRVRS